MNARISTLAVKTSDLQLCRPSNKWWVQVLSLRKINIFDTAISVTLSSNQTHFFLPNTVLLKSELIILKPYINNSLDSFKGSKFFSFPYFTYVNRMNLSLKLLHT